MESNALNFLRGFASGEISPRDFRDRLYADDAFESMLNEDPHLDPANYVGGSVYQFLITCDFDDPGGVLNAHGAVCDFLDRNGHQYKRTEKYADYYKLVLEASPHWLAADPKYVRDHIMPQAAGRSGEELRQWLSEQLMEKYRFVSKPPEWIQSPCWPHSASGPLVFLGQLDVAGYFHDLATVYVFHDQDTGECQTVIQCF